MPVCGYVNVADTTESVAREIAHRLVRMGELGVLETTLAATGDMRGISALEGDQIQAIPGLFAITLATMPGATATLVIKVKTIGATTDRARAMLSPAWGVDTKRGQHTRPAINSS